MKKITDRSVHVNVVVLAVAFGALGLFAGVGAQGQNAPRYKFDPDWPKPLPNKWKIGGVIGLGIDKDDNVWVYHRPTDLTSLELEAEVGVSDCCVRPPSMIHLSKDGSVLGSFDAPQGHGMDVDDRGFAYLGQDTVRKYDTRTGTLVGEIPRIPERVGGGPNQPAAIAARVPGQGGPAPVTRFLLPPNGPGYNPVRAGGRGDEEAGGVLREVPAIYADDGRHHSRKCVSTKRTTKSTSPRTILVDACSCSISPRWRSSAAGAPTGRSSRTSRPIPPTTSGWAPRRRRSFSRT